jgi:hypothetical protein
MPCYKMKNLLNQCHFAIIKGQISVRCNFTLFSLKGRFFMMLLLINICRQTY